MDWSNERYVRLYTRDTTTWRLLSWQAQAILPQLLRVLDRSGVLDIGSVDPVSAVAAHLTKWPREVVAEGLTGKDGLVDHDVFEIGATAIVMPNFMEAQEAIRSDAQRKREERERRRTVKRHENGRSGHENGRKRHAVSRDIHPSLAMPSLALPSQGEDNPPDPPNGDGLSLPPTPEELQAIAAASPFASDPEHGLALGSMSSGEWPANGKRPNGAHAPETAFALTPQRPASRRSNGVRKTVADDRIERARGVWERYEAHRVQALGGRQRKPDEKKLIKAAKAIVQLVEHVRGVESVDEESAWARVEAYGRGAVDEAADPGHRDDWARKLAEYRADWSEWRASRFDKWAAQEGTKRRGTRRFMDPAHMDYDSETPF